MALGCSEVNGGCRWLWSGMELVVWGFSSSSTPVSLVASQGKPSIPPRAPSWVGDVESKKAGLGEGLSGSVYQWAKDLALAGHDYSMRKPLALATMEFAACCSTRAWLGGLVWFLSSPAFWLSLASCYGGEGLYFLIHLRGCLKIFAKDYIRALKRRKGSKNDTRDNTQIFDYMLCLFLLNRWSSFLGSSPPDTTHPGQGIYFSSLFIQDCAHSYSLFSVIKWITASKITYYWIRASWACLLPVTQC